MIIVKISGGLGNQLFQYAFGQYVAKYLGTEVKYDLRLNIRTKDFTNRNFEMKNFQLEVNEASANEIKKIKFFLNGFPERLERKLVNLFPNLNKSYIIESAAFSLREILLKDNCYYDGYWQYYYYPLEIRYLIVDRLTLKIPHSNPEINALVGSNAQTVSIHIRRGDYISNAANQAIYSICDMTYYEKAIEIFNNKLGKPNYLIFSDDIQWAKSHFIGSEYYFVEGNCPSVDMFVMSCCNHHIIANSTFSWWAAWMNKNDNKMIIAPSKWFNGDMNHYLNKLLPEHWINI